MDVQNVAGTCLDLFFQFESVTFLHAEVESIVVGILESASTELLSSLIKDARLLPRVLEAFEQNQRHLEDKTRVFSFGYMGHLTRICQVIVSLTYESEDECAEEKERSRAQVILEMLKEDQDSWVRWDAFVQEHLLAKIEQDRHPLGGGVAFIGQGLNALEEFHQDCLNEEFTEMLGQAEYIPGSTTLENEYDYNGTSASLIIPPSVDDSSSSDEDEDDHCFTNYAAQSANSKLQTSSAVHNDATEWAAPSDTDHWARFEHNATFSAPFDQFQPEMYNIPIPTEINDDDSSVHEVEDMANNDVDVEDVEREIPQEVCLEDRHSDSIDTGDPVEETREATIDHDDDNQTT